MRRILVAAVLLAATSVVLASPFVVSDPVDPVVTHCGVLLDTQAKVVIPVTVESGQKICKYDLAGIARGSHVVRMTAIMNDPIWGSQESAQSDPLSFVAPSAPNVPAGLELQP